MTSSNTTTHAHTTQSQTAILPIVRLILRDVQPRIVIEHSSDFPVTDCLWRLQMAAEGHTEFTPADDLIELGEMFDRGSFAIRGSLEMAHLVTSASELAAHFNSGTLALGPETTPEACRIVDGFLAAVVTVKGGDDERPV